MQRKIAFTMLVLTLFTSGCTLQNPYITPFSEDNSSKNNSSEDVSKCNIVTEMADAISCAEKVKGKYVKGMKHQAQLTSWTGIGLIPLTAYTTGLAIRGGQEGNVTDFALGAAALYSLSQWLSMPERSQIYGLGQTAIQCAIDAAGPLTISKADLNTIETNKDSLISARSAYQTALTNLESASRSVRARKLINNGRLKLLEVNKTLNEVSALIGRYKKAPQKLVNASKRINASVNEALATTVQSLSSLPGLMSGINQIYTDTVSGFPEAFQPMTTKSDKHINIEAKDNIKSLVNKLMEANTRLETALSTVKSDLVTFAIEAPTETLDTCSIDASSVKTPISLSSSTLKFTVGENIRQTVKIFGGSGTYVAYYNEDQLDITQTPQFGDTLVVSLNNAGAGTAVATIKDTAGASKTLQVNILPANGTEGADDVDNGDGDENCNPKLFEEQGITLTEDELELCGNQTKVMKLQEILQNELSVPDDFVDGHYGPETRAAIIKFIQQQEHLGQVDAVQRREIQAIAAFDHERLLSEEDKQSQISRIREASGEEDNDDNDRQLIMQFQKNEGLPAHGFLGAATMEALQD